MRWLMILICVVAWLALSNTSALAIEDDAGTPVLVEQLQTDSDAAASGAALFKLRQMLTAGSADVVARTQTRLCEALLVSNDSLSIRRISLLLSAPPCESAVVILASRLGSNPPPAVTMALCDGIHAVAGQRSPLSPPAAALALERLEEVSRNARLPGPVIDAAIMATAAFGSAGFDQLMRLKADEKASGKIRHVIHSALAETDDPRALAVLRQAVTDASISDSRRAQAIYGLGQMFSRADSVGRAMNPAERDACATLMKAYLGDATPDRVYVSALKAVAQMVDMQADIGLEQTVLNALESASAARREAALEVLCQHGGPLDPTLSAMIEGIAQLDSSAEVRSAAAVVLETDQAYRSGTLPDSK